MRKQEQRVWDTMKRQAPPGTWMERVENVVADGMPDVWVGGSNAHAWVELKAAKVPARLSTPLLGADGLRQSQLNWHKKAAQRNLPAYTLVRDDRGRLYLVHCQHSEHLNSMTAEQMAEVSVASDWKTIFEVIAI